MHIISVPAAVNVALKNTSDSFSPLTIGTVFAESNFVNIDCAGVSKSPDVIRNGVDATEANQLLQSSARTPARVVVEELPKGSTGHALQYSKQRTKSKQPPLRTSKI